jgi:CheY-like chemotaxis protein
MSAEPHGKTVLVVDDDSIFHFLLKKMLLTLGVTPEFIQTARNGKEALDHVVTCLLSGIPLPDVILLDLNMPIMGGFEFLEAYKKLPLIDESKTQIIITSSSLNDSDVTRSLQLGATRYLTKPVTETELQQVLK